MGKLLIYRLSILPEKVLHAPLRSQVVGVAAELCDLDLPGPGGQARPALRSDATAQLEGQLVAAVGGLNVHYK